MADHGSSRIPGFYELDVQTRRDRVRVARGLDDAELASLDDGGLDVETADHMIENVIGMYGLPLGVALNFIVDGVDYMVPMAIEEPSVVAAASNAAKMIRASGGFHSESTAPVMIGQVQLCGIADIERSRAALETATPELIDQARALCPRLVARGGGPRGIRVRCLSRPGDPDGGMLVVHVLVDCRDAMGANLVNSVAEGLANNLAEIAGGQVGLRILSNLCDTRTVRVTARVADADLAAENGAAVRAGIVAASRFAELDPYRAATHNKGIMNGVDAVLLATGNDWRSAEAGAHAYAARDGQYKPLAVWRSEANALVGTLEMPLAVGTVGGALHVHRGARMALSLLGIDRAAILAAVVASAGLASNLAALRALATDGIQRGHMSLHARVVARAAGATGDLIDRVATEIAARGEVKTDVARQILDRLRAENQEQRDPAQECT